MSRHAALVIALGVSLPGAVAAKPSQPSQPLPRQQDQQKEDRQNSDDGECPESVRGVTIGVKERPGAVVLTFTTTEKKHVSDLQILVREAAAYVEFRSKMAELHAEAMLAFDDTPVPAVDIAVKDVASGAEATVRAEDAQDYPVVVAQARKLKQLWEESRCLSTGNAPTPKQVRS
jgi:hypothetical protein